MVGWLARYSCTDGAVAVVDSAFQQEVVIHPAAAPLNAPCTFPDYTLALGC